MILEIPFNKSLYIEQSTLFFDTAWVKNLKKRKNNLIVGIVSLLMGTAMLISEKEIGFLFIFIGFLGLNYSYKLHEAYKKNKKAYFDLIAKNITLEEEQKQPTIWEFEDTHFRYKDLNVDVTLQWRTIKGFKIIKNTVFIYSEFGMNLIFSENETENFDRIIAFLKQKTTKIKD